MDVANAVRRALPRARSDAERQTADAAFASVVAPIYPDLVRRLVLVLGDIEEARDVAQDASLQAWQAWDRFDGVNPRGWLYTIALRLAFNRLRSRQRWLRAVHRVEPRPWADAADPDLWQALGVLDPRVRAALLLQVVDGYTQAEIAAMLGVPSGTIASWSTRGRATVRRVLEGGEGHS